MANAWVEERVEAMRLAVGFRGRPRDNSIWQVYELLEGAVSVRWGEVRVGRVRFLADGRKQVTLPARLVGMALDREACHEVAHALLSVGMGPMLRESAGGDFRLLRLAEGWEARDEAHARQFVQAWYLPSQLVLEHRGDPALLVEESGLDWELVQERVTALGRNAYAIERPPRWSAFWSYHVVMVTHAQHPSLWVARRGSPAPAFLFPVNRFDGQRSAMRLNAELIALTDDEFERVYEQFRVEPPVEVAPSVDELSRWLKDPDRRSA